MVKTVVFTQRVEIKEKYEERRDCIDQRIWQFIFSCGYLPCPVPNDINIAKSIVNQIKPIGIVMTGGNSLVKYNGNAPERDRVEYGLIDLSIEKKIPLYGFCRGMQVILDYFGNELIDVEGHVAKKHIVRGSGGVYNVNSFHNQACVKLCTSDLMVEMMSDDGVIEMIRHKCYPILGTMWHPEREKIWKEYDINNVKGLFG